MLTYVVLSFCRVGSFLGNELVVRVFPFTDPRVLEEAQPVCSMLVVTTEDGTRVFPFTGPRVLEDVMKLLVSWNVSSDAKPVCSVSVEWIAAVVNVSLSASRVLVSGEEMNVG